MTGTKSSKLSGALESKGDTLPSNLKRSKSGIYQYRKSVPIDVRHIIQKTEFKESLGSDHQVAMVKYTALEAETTRLIYDARIQIGNTPIQRTEAAAIEEYRRKMRSKPGAPKNAGMTFESLKPGKDLVLHVAGLYYLSLENDLNARRTGSDPEYFAQLTSTYQHMRELIDKAATGDVDMIPNIMMSMLNQRGYDAFATADEWQTMAFDFAMEIKDGVEALFERQRGNFKPLDLTKYIGKIPGPAWMPELVPLPAPKPAPPPPPRPRLSAVTPIYEERLKKIVQRKTRTTRLSWWNRLVDFCHDMPLEDVTHNHLFDFFKNRLEMADDNWTMDTCNKVRREFVVVFALADVSKLPNNNPAAALVFMPEISPKEDKKRKKPRHPFSDKQLNTIFASEWYDPESEKMRSRMKWDLAARYWIPLLCLHHGFRVREATQLCLHDITRGPIPLMAIQVDTEDDVDSPSRTQLPNRSLKNDATKRIVPIHPKLIELGFMELVEQAESRGRNSPLFVSSLPEVNQDMPSSGTTTSDTNEAAMWGRAFEQSFVRHVRDTLAFGSGFGTHGFRHTLEDRLRDVQAIHGTWPAGLTQYYSGRKSPSDQDKGFFRALGSEQHYGQGFNPTLVLPFFEKVQFENVKFPRPYSQWLNGRPPVDSRLIALLDRDYGTAWRTHP